MLVDFIYYRLHKETPKYYKLFYYLFIFSCYVYTMNHLPYEKFEGTYFGMPTKYWFMFVSFIGVYVVAFLIDIVFVSQKNITEISTQGIKLSEKNRQIFKDQTKYLKFFESILKAENEIIQNTFQYIRVDGYDIGEALIILLEDENSNLIYDEYKILEDYLNHYFNLKNPSSPAKVFTYTEDTIEHIQRDFDLKTKEFIKIKQTLIDYEYAYNIDEENIIYKKKRNHYILCFCYYYQHIGKNVIIGIESEDEILNTELLILSNILKTYESYMFTVCCRIQKIYQEPDNMSESKAN